LQKKLLKFLNYFVFLSLGIFLLWLVTKDQDLNKLWTEIKQANYFWVLMSLVAGLCSHLFRALRWNLMLKTLGHHTKTITTFWAVMVGYFANLAIPRLGEVARCGALSRQNRIPFNEVFGTVVAERAFDMIVLLLIITGVIVFQLQLLGDFIQINLLDPLSQKFSNPGNMTIILLTSLIGLILLTILLYRLFLPRLRKIALYQKILGLMKGFVEGIKSLWKMKQKLLFLLYTLCIWFMYSMMNYLIFFALTGTTHLNFGDAITIMALGSLGIVAPVPGGIGTYHAVVILVMTSLYHISKQTATTYAYVSHTSQVIMMVAVGIIALMMLSFSAPKKEKDEAN
jgi:glycosyltransferase 2 family protein